MIALKLLWVVAVPAALVLLAHGLLAEVYFEPTGEAIAEAHRGQAEVGGACLLLVLAAGYAVLVARWPAWVGVAVAFPAVVSGGLSLLVPDSWFPLLSLPLVFPSALVGAIGGLLARRRAREPVEPVQQS